MRRDNSWQLFEAKAHLSELLRLTEFYPQTITLHGRPAAMVLHWRTFKSMLKDLRRLKELDEAQSSKEPEPDTFEEDDLTSQIDNELENM